MDTNLTENIAVIYYSDKNGEKPGVIYNEKYASEGDATKEAHLWAQELTSKGIPGGQVRIQKIFSNGQSSTLAYETVGA